MQALDHVARSVLADIRKKVAPSDEYTEAMLAWYNYNTRKPITASLKQTADITFTIRASKKQSEILEALLLSHCPYETIEEALSVPIKVSKWYAELFFDLSAFKTDLDRIEYLEEYDNPAGKDLKLKAFNLGYEFVLFTYANLVPKTDSQKKLVERMFMATAYKAMHMNYNGINSSVNKQAVKHAELMIKAYELLVKTNQDDSNNNYDLVSLLAADDALDKQMEAIKAEEVI